MHFLISRLLMGFFSLEVNVISPRHVLGEQRTGKERRLADILIASCMMSVITSLVGVPSLAFYSLAQPPVFWLNTDGEKIYDEVFDGDEKFTLKEVKDFISRFINRQEILLIGIYWIGWSIDP